MEEHSFGINKAFMKYSQTLMGSSPGKGNYFLIEDESPQTVAELGIPTPSSSESP